MVRSETVRLRGSRAFVVGSHLVFC